ncbi:MAG: TIR domain-containing protein [Acidobacteriota bacterium]
MARDTPVFISYARRDERHATELMRRLALEPDIAPWQDRISMSPGDFEDQLRAGIDASDYLVLVMTPAALRSPWVEKEWRYAREHGRCIVPIKPTFDSPDIDRELDAVRAQLPVWMQKIQTYDFDRYWKRFIAVLQSPCQATRAPFLAASLPAHFVDRPAEFHRIVGTVLDAARGNPSGRTVVLHGTGGFGKTTLALSVCQDADVFAACDGGILWVTLGEQPQIVTELERLYAALTGQRPGFKNQDDAMFEVASTLDGKRCLLVIDDVWSLQALKPFLYGAPATSRLVTSRVFSVAVGAAADERCRINVGELSPAEGERMLAAGLSVPAESAWHLGLLVERLKRVPLLLELASRTLAGQVALGQSVDRALDWALRKYADLGVVAFDETNAAARHDAIGSTVEVSLGFFADERQRCLELGVLHEDADIPFSVLQTLWGLKETPVQDLVQRLHDFGLIKLNLPGRSIRLHDYIRAYLEGILPDRAGVHGRLVDAWIGERQLPAGYPVQQIVFHIVEAMADPAAAAPRATQVIALLSEQRFQRYQRQHGDATALDRQLTLAITRAAESAAPEIPAQMARLLRLRKSYAATARDAALVFQTAAGGRLAAAAELLTLFEADRDWNTLARLLIAWVAPGEKADEARAFVAETAESCDTVDLRTALAWVRQPGGGVPPGLSAITGGPDLRQVAAILQRAGGAETSEGLEPLAYEDLASGTDAAGFIAERDGPDLVAFARLDPAANTQYLERYLDIHAANRYAHYRNRSLSMLLQPILQFPDPIWVRALVQRITTAALTATSVDFEEFLPLAVRGVRARQGDPAAAAELERARQQLLETTAALRPDEGRTDSWSHYQRRASALAEVLAVAHGRRSEAADLLRLARELPKGFAGFRAPSALTLAESALIAAPDDAAARDAALVSATAAAHRIQDHRFCLQMTAMVNAVRFRWSDLSGIDLEATVTRFIDAPLAAGFCAVHRVLDPFEHRDQDQQYFQALPIPGPVRQARTLRAIAGIFDCQPPDLIAVNEWIWAAPDAVLDEVLQDGDQVNIPDPDFVPILAARFAAAALIADGWSAEMRSRTIQRLVRMALPNPTALDTVLGRLILSTLDRPQHLPLLLHEMELSDPAAADAPAHGSHLSVL